MSSLDCAFTAGNLPTTGEEDVYTLIARYSFMYLTAQRGGAGLWHSNKYSFSFLFDIYVMVWRRRCCCRSLFPADGGGRCCKYRQFFAVVLLRLDLQAVTRRQDSQRSRHLLPPEN